eukprot:13717835-Alexandrium_andersonii.AAC.1
MAAAKIFLMAAAKIFLRAAAKLPPRWLLLDSWRNQFQNAGFGVLRNSHFGGLHIRELRSGGLRIRGLR